MIQLRVVLLFSFIGAIWAQCQHASQGGSRYRTLTQPCIVNRMLDPVCGTDGCSYVNMAALECGQAEDRANSVPEDQVVQFLKRGMCDEEGDAPTINPNTTGQEENRVNEDNQENGRQIFP